MKVLFVAFLMGILMFSCTKNNTENKEVAPADTTVVEKDSTAVDTLIADTVVTEVIAE